MQTFLIDLDYQISAQQLDRPGRLGKQRLEAVDCLKLNLHLNYGITREALDFPEWLIKRYGNHPCRKMWAGYEWELWKYCSAIINEWRNCNYKDCCLVELDRLYDLMGNIQDNGKPPWLTEEFCSTHRAVLLGKVEEKSTSKVKSWYQQFDWPEQPAKRNSDDKWPYLWSGEK